MKTSKILFIIFLTMTTFNIFSVDINYYKALFSSPEVADHKNAVLQIQEGKEILKGNKEIVTILLEEFEFAKSMEKITTNPEGLYEFKSLVVETLGDIADISVIDKIVNVLTYDKQVNVLKAGVVALGGLGDNDNYASSIALVAFTKRENYKVAIQDEHFASALMVSLDKLVKDKPFDVIEYLKILDIYRDIIKNSEAKPSVKSQAKRKLLELMLANS